MLFRSLGMSTALVSMSTGGRGPWPQMLPTPPWCTAPNIMVPLGPVWSLIQGQYVEKHGQLLVPIMLVLVGDDDQLNGKRLVKMLHKIVTDSFGCPPGCKPQLPLPSCTCKRMELMPLSLASVFTMNSPATHHNPSTGTPHGVGHCCTVSTFPRFISTPALLTM